MDKEEIIGYESSIDGARGYSVVNLWRMRNFYLTYNNSVKLAPLVREISLSNYLLKCTLATTGCKCVFIHTSRKFIPRNSIINVCIPLKRLKT